MKSESALLWFVQNVDLEARKLRKHSRACESCVLYVRLLSVPKVYNLMYAFLAIHNIVIFSNIFGAQFQGQWKWLSLAPILFKIWLLPTNKKNIFVNGYFYCFVLVCP